MTARPDIRGNLEERAAFYAMKAAPLRCSCQDVHTGYSPNPAGHRGCLGPGIFEVTRCGSRVVLCTWCTLPGDYDPAFVSRVEDADSWDPQWRSYQPFVIPKEPA